MEPGLALSRGSFNFFFSDADHDPHKKRAEYDRNVMESA